MSNDLTDNLRDALRRGLQAAFAAVATYALMRALGLSEIYLAVISAVLILQPSIGGTMGAAIARLQATLAGSLMGLACLLLLPQGWGTAAALGLAMLVVGGLAGLRSDWSYGTVAAVAIALAPKGDLLATAWVRGLALALGAGVGVLVSFLVWPDRAEARFERHLRTAMRAAARRLADVTEAAMERGRESAPPAHVSAYHKAVDLAQEALDAARLVNRAGMEHRLGALRRLYNSIIVLDRAAEVGALVRPGDQDLHERARRLRQDACSALIELAEGDWSPGRPIGLPDAARQLPAEWARHDPVSGFHHGRHAVAFGLHEVGRTLEALANAQSQHHAR